jgi:hypothetical protein
MRELNWPIVSNLYELTSLMMSPDVPRLTVGTNGVKACQTNSCLGASVHRNTADLNVENWHLVPKDIAAQWFEGRSLLRHHFSEWPADMLVCQVTVHDPQSYVDADKSQIMIEQRKADGRGGDPLQQLRFLTLQLSDSIAQALHCTFVAGIH